MPKLSNIPQFPATDSGLIPLADSVVILHQRTPFGMQSLRQMLLSGNIQRNRYKRALSAVSNSVGTASS
jgi:hypothetical protein